MKQKVSHKDVSHRTTEHTSTPHNELERKQKARTDQELADFWSAKNKLDSQKRTLPSGEYPKRLNALALKYSLSKKEREEFLETI